MATLKGWKGMLQHYMMTCDMQIASLQDDGACALQAADLAKPMRVGDLPKRDLLCSCLATVAVAVASVMLFARIRVADLARIHRRELKCRFFSHTDSNVKP